MALMKIRVLTGCQMDGLVSALQILFPQADVGGFHTYRLLGEDRAEIREGIRAADILFVSPLEPRFGDFASDRIHALGPKIQRVPHVVFAAFHPDITYLERPDGSRIQTPLTDYNSVIAIAAYMLGFDVKRTSRLYNAYIFNALGYFSLLEKSKASLLADFQAHGIDLRQALVRWLDRPEAFMYSMNHPKSFVIADVAVAACRAAGLELGPSLPSFETMPDMLGDWVVYPVFKEIASRLGKNGPSHFKMVGTGDSCRLSLPDFIERSFAGYGREDVSRCAVTPRIASVRSILGQLVRKPAAVGTRPMAQASSSDIAYAAPQTVDCIEDCYFYHTMDFADHGTQQGGWDLRGRFADYIGGLDLTDLRVLDVGAASGFLSFSAEEAGAREVVSFDLDTADRQHLLPFADSDYVTDHASWSAKQTAAFQRWKNAYWFTHRLKKSKAKAIYGDIYALPEAIGQFDVVIVGAILEHLADPIRALASVARHASDIIVINTDYIDGDEPMARFNGRPDQPGASYIFWTYSIKTYEQIMGIIGFEIVSVKKDAFIARGANGERIDSERVAIVCRRCRKKHHETRGRPHAPEAAIGKQGRNSPGIGRPGDGSVR